MSRIGRRPVELPNGVSLTVSGRELSVKGPLGSLTQVLPDGVEVKVDGQSAQVLPPTRLNRTNKGFLGLTRALVANMVHGVVKGYEKSLVLSGVGYRANLKGTTLTMSVGYSHDIVFKVPEGVKVEVDKSQTNVKVSGLDKHLVGRVAAQLREYKKCEPYNGKGIRYSDEIIRRKAGKTAKK